jgi:SAM-dependent methyltransferase
LGPGYTRTSGESTLDSIEVLAPSLLEEMPELLAEMRSVVRELPVARGWHYYMDFCWAARVLEPTAGMKVLDAGGGNGVMQWWLARHGARVLSVDLEGWPHQGKCFDDWCERRQWGEEPSRTALTARSFLPPRRFWSPSEWAEKVRRTRGLFDRSPPRFQGSIEVWQNDLRNLSQLESDSMDAIVSISALEHNELDDLRAIVRELERVLKPGGKMAITVGGARDEDWFHEPSKGWCYSEKTLSEVFGLDAYESNFARYDEILDDLVHCDELREDLPAFYFESGDNGMPWGRWDPQYQSVGIFKTKPRPGS